MKKLLDYIGWLLLVAATFYHFVFEESDVGNNLAIIPEIGAALIGAGGSLFSSIFGGSSSAESQEKTNQMNLQIARENNQFNAEQAQLNRDWQEKMWNAQNAYNDPKAAAMRSIAAGINPYIDEGSAGSIISNGAAGSAGSGATATAAAAPQMVAPNYDFVGNSVGSAIQAGLSVVQSLAEQSESSARTAKILSDIGYQEKDYQLRKSADQISRDMLALNREQMGYQNELMRWQMAESSSRIATEQWNRQLIDSNIRLNEYHAKSIQNDLDNYAQILALRWFDAKTGRISATAALRQANTMAEQLAFAKDQYGNFNIPGLDDTQRNRLKQESFNYLLNSLMSQSASASNDRSFELGYYQDMPFLNYFQRALGGTLKKAANFVGVGRN